MDLLKSLQNLAVDDKKQANHQTQQSMATAPAAHESVFDKINDAFHGSHFTPTPTPAPVPEQSGADKLFSKINDALGGSLGTPVPAPASVTHQSSSDKILSMFSESIGGKPETHVATPAPAPKAENLFNKIGDALSGRKTPPPPPPPAKAENLIGKLSNVLTGTHVVPEPKHESISDKINSVLGGGNKGEAQEDKLDKGKSCIINFYFCSHCLGDSYRPFPGTCSRTGPTGQRICH